MFLNIYDKNLFNRLNSNIPVDIIEHNDFFDIMAELPGFTKEQISVDFKENTLLISVSSENNNSYENAKIWLKERFHSNKERSFIFDDLIDVDNINANFENGVLNLKLPKKENSTLVKKINIS